MGRRIHRLSSWSAVAGPNVSGRIELSEPAASSSGRAQRPQGWPVALAPGCCVSGNIPLTVAA